MCVRCHEYCYVHYLDDSLFDLRRCHYSPTNMKKRKKETTNQSYLNNETIREAVWLWEHDQAQAAAEYGHINKWNTSQVTDMSDLFKECDDFNDNISEWDVSNVTSMKGLFHWASSFNQDISKWDVHNVKDMSYMFCFASSFNQELCRWNVSSVMSMSHMFCGASSFKHNIREWNIHKKTNINNMFRGAWCFCENLSTEEKFVSSSSGWGYDSGMPSSSQCFFFVHRYKRKLCGNKEN